MNNRSLLFYSAWPLGYHNLEAERKAAAFGAAGYDVVYVAGVGIRNPRPSSVGKLADRVGRKLARAEVSGAPPGVRTAAVLVAPPRQFETVRRLNGRWLENQLREALPEWSSSVAWIRWPTPELIPALDRLGPAAIIYDCVDPHHLSPGIVGRWAHIHEHAERALVERSDRVIVPGDALGDRFRAWGADVTVVPHGVDVKVPSTPPRPAREVVGFIGTLDYKLDIAIIRAIAEGRPERRLRLIGPVQEGFDPAQLADLTNVSIEPPIPHSEVGNRLAELDLGIMPYIGNDDYRASAPLKTLEFFAAGLPVVAQPSPAVLQHSDLLYVAETPEQFVRQLDSAASERNPDLADRRRALAAGNSWDARMADLRRVVDEVLVEKADA